MDYNKACQILGVSSNATKEEITAAFRKLAKEHHPDRNPEDPNAEGKFKEINAAYQYLLNPPNKNGDMFRRYNGENVDINDFINDIFDGFRKPRSPFRKQSIQCPEVKIYLSFNEAVLGCKKEIEFEYLEKCNMCDGDGGKVGNDACTVCNGSGVKQSTFGTVYIQTSCDACGGIKRVIHNCNDCSGSGTVKGKKKLQVDLPGGIKDGQILTFARAGNFFKSPFGGKTYTDVILYFSVEKDPDMIMDGQDVISNVNLTLLEALKGTSQKVRTVKGEFNLKIKPGVRHNEKLSVRGYGVGGTGNHIFILDVKYPDDLSKLIGVLENE